MFKRIKEMWNRAFGPFYVAGPETTITNLYYPVVNKALTRVTIDGIQYEYWVNANTPWNEPGFLSVGHSPHYDIYRREDYDEAIGHFDERFKDGTLMLERMADAVHDIWAKWMQWQFTKGFGGPRGQFTIDSSSVMRWMRQMETPYAELSESEKTSDRDIARRYLRLIMMPEK